MPTALDNLSDETRDQLAQMALNLSANKDTRKGFLGLVKKANPQTPIPELDEVEALQAQLRQRDERMDKIEKERADEKFANSLASQKAEARSKYGLSDEQFTKMEEMMKKGELPADYRFAPQLFSQQIDTSTPTNYGTSGFGPFDLQKNAGAMEGLMDDENWASRTAHNLIDDMHRQGKAKAF